MSEWTALLARITIFPAPLSVTLPSALDLYKKVWEGDPTSFQGPTNPLSPSLAQGKHAGLAISCSVHQSRIDFNLSPVGPESASETPKLFVIEDSKELHDEFASIARTIGKGLLATSVLRVATFLQFVSIEANSMEANKALMSIVPEQYRIKLGDEEEFVLQISRPRTSEHVEKLKMNLITKWSVQRFQVVSLLVPMGAVPIVAAPQSGIAPQVTEFITASVGFDINNAPVAADRPLSSGQQSSLLLEGLAHTARSMREDGLKIKGFENGKLTH